MRALVALAPCLTRVWSEAERRLTSASVQGKDDDKKMRRQDKKRALSFVIFVCEVNSPPIC